MDSRTDGVDIGTPPSTDRTLVPNRVLMQLRTDREWGRPRLAREFERFCQFKGWPPPDRAAIEKQIYRLETGRSRVPDEFYTNLYCAFFKKSAGELFGITSTPRSAEQCNLTSHKFVPAFVGAEAAELLATKLDMGESEQWLACCEASVDHPDGDCTLYVFPFGVAMFHIVEPKAITSVSELAVWRPASYEENREWAADRLWELLGAATAAPNYVLSLYHVREPCWPEQQLDTALRLLSVPRVLLDREADSAEAALARAELVERTLLREGFDHGEVVDFGVKGVAKGFASWSGVVYHPTSETRALAERELVQCETSVQALWAYCDHIRSEVERGTDPVVPDQHGWRFLRAARSRLTNERPCETSQHRSMREAIIETRGLGRHLTQAVETLREVGGVR